MNNTTDKLAGLRVLITGAGGPAGYSVLERLAEAMPELELHAADASPLASGLYLVGDECRHVVPRGDHPDFVAAIEALCREHAIGLVIPTVDSELLPLSVARARFTDLGTRVAVAEPMALRLCRDKLALTRTLARSIPTARSAPWRGSHRAKDWTLPAVIKPRSGAGSRGVHIVRSQGQLAAIPPSEQDMIMEHLPGAEYSVDVFRNRHGVVIATVPRERMRVDSGVAIAARTLRDPELERFAALAVEAIDLTGVANVQFRRDDNGVPKLLEINPRFPGTGPLTTAAGVDMPTLCVRDAMRLPGPNQRMDFREIAVVRRWQNQFLDADTLDYGSEETDEPLVSNG